MAQRRRFTGEFKARVVLELLSGTKSAAELCREHQLSPQLLGQWKSELLARAPQIFEQEQARSVEQERIAELERLVGRLTMQLEIAKKASTLLGAQPSRNDR
jgi:transposase